MKNKKQPITAMQLAMLVLAGSGNSKKNTEDSKKKTENTNEKINKNGK